MKVRLTLSKKAKLTTGFAVQKFSQRTNKQRQQVLIPAAFAEGIVPAKFVMLGPGKAIR